jgi:hypothetical protein
VSLILEALKKLEREKGVPERGFLVMAHLPWARSGKVGARLLGLAALALALAAAGFLLWRSRPAPLVAPAPTPTFVARPPRGGVLALPSPIVALPLPTSALPLPTSALPSPAATAPPASPAPDLAAPRPPEAASQFRLNAISVQDGHPVAVLNDRIVREGDSFEGVRVLRIGETEVEIEVRGERRVIRF